MNLPVCNLFLRVGYYVWAIYYCGPNASYNSCQICFLSLVLKLDMKFYRMNVHGTTHVLESISI